jgi:hypothetical protein
MTEEEIQALIEAAVARELLASLDQPAGQPANLRAQPEESREAYRARLAAAQPVQQSDTSLAMDAQAAEAIGMHRPASHQLYDNVIGSDDGVTSPGEAFGTWMNRAGESSTLGLVGDEANAALYGMLPGRSYEGELERFRANEEGLGTWGKLSADIFGGVLPALAGVGVVAQAPGLLSRMGTGALLGGGAGATQGFMEGEGGASNRMISGGVGAGIGLTLGGAVPLLGEIGRAGVRGATNMMRDSRIGNRLAGELGVSPEAARVVASMVGVDDQASMADALRRAGPNAMLADASPAISGTLDATLQSPVPGVMAARQRISDRAGQSYDDIMRTVQGSGPVRGVQGSMDEIVESTRGARASAYNAAYSQPIDYSSPQGLRLTNDIAPRLPREAVEYANRLMRLNGEESAQIMARIADDGSVAFERLPDVRQWDYIKQALDQMAESGDGAGAMGGQTRLGSAYQSLARDVRRTLGQAVPEYNTAVETAADAITRRNAVQFGTELLSPRTTTEEALSEIAEATGPQLEAMRDGLRGQLREAFGNVNAVASDQNIDARQAAAALRQFTSPNAQAKMEALFGEAWPELQTQIEQAGAALGLRARVATNSMTAGRGFANQMIDEVTAPGAIQRGKPVEALSNFFGGVTGASPDAVRRMGEGVRSELAGLLTQQGGAPQRTLDAVSRVLQQNPANLQSGEGLLSLINTLGLGSIPAATNQALGLLQR